VTKVFQPTIAVHRLICDSGATPRRGEHYASVASAPPQPRTAGRKRTFDYELLVMFVRNELSAQATIMLLAAIFSLASMFWAPWTQAILWLTIVIAAKVILLEICRRFMLVQVSEADVALWRRRLITAEAINGLAWAGFALVGMHGVDAAAPGYPFSSNVFVFASLMVVLAIRMTFASSVMPILYIGTIPMTVAVVMRLMLLGDFFYFALASMAVGVHIYFIFLAKGLHSTALAMLEFRAQKDVLIAELEEAKAISEEARRRAEAANLAKSRFLATMSHELRTPLNAVLGFSEVMKNEIMGPMLNPTYKGYASNIHQSGSHLLNLINEILDLSRIEAGRHELDERAIDLAGVVEDCHRLLKLKADDKGQTIVELFEEELPQVWADERAVRQIVLNLLSNALKFTPCDGRIVLSVRRTAEGGQLIGVRDNGPGIPAGEIQKVLQPFGQGSLAHQTAEGGTGLGLPIVQSLIELHGGSFELRSESRLGTEAIVYFPPRRILQPLRSARSAQREFRQEAGFVATRPARPARLKSVEGARTGGTPRLPTAAIA
jgi:two-component system cell cycle sensor histidine kinase PleC